MGKTPALDSRPQPANGNEARELRDRRQAYGEYPPGNPCGRATHPGRARLPAIADEREAGDVGAAARHGAEDKRGAENQEGHGGGKRRESTETPGPASSGTGAAASNGGARTMAPEGASQ
eukprot:5278719-Prymnesium_polylepis.1